MKTTTSIITTACRVFLMGNLMQRFFSSNTLGGGGGVQATTIPGVNYSPFHHPLYPTNANVGLDTQAILYEILDEDFNQISKYFSAVRTFYSNYYGQEVASVAAKHNLSLYLGIHMTDYSWGQAQIDQAIASAIAYPNTVTAIIIGSENVQIGNHGNVPVQSLITLVQSVRAQLSDAGVSHVKVGTSQRINEWLVSQDVHGEAAVTAMHQLGNVCDIIGVTIYPFFSHGLSLDNPAALLQAQWTQMRERYPTAKLRVTETGFPTDGNTPEGFTDTNQPSLTSSQAYYDMFMRWSPPSAGNGEKFYFMFYDQAEQTTPSYEEHFGVKLASGGMKFPLYLRGN